MLNSLLEGLRSWLGGEAAEEAECDGQEEGEPLATMTNGQGLEEKAREAERLVAILDEEGGPAEDATAEALYQEHSARVQAEADAAAAQRKLAVAQEQFGELLAQRVSARRPCPACPGANGCAACASSAAAARVPGG